MSDPSPASYLPAAPLSPADQRLWATLISVGGILFHPWAALVGYLALRDRGDFVRDHARAALNFQLTLLIAYLAGVVLIIAVIGIFIVMAAAIVNIIFSILAAIAANNGERYRYPFAIEFVK